MAKAETAGAEGHVDESLKLMEEVEELKKQKGQAEVGSFEYIVDVCLFFVFSRPSIFYKEKLVTPPPPALQMGCYESRAFKVPKLIVAERKLQRNKVFCPWKRNPYDPQKKKTLRVSVAATPYHLLIDIVGRT